MDIDGGSQRLRPGLGLLGGHVARRPDRGAGPGEAGLAIQPPGQPEVADLGRAVGGEEDVGRLQVAMHDPAPVGRLDGFGQGRQQRGGLAGRLGHARQFLGQVAPLDKLHGEVGQAVLVAHVVDLDDIGMPQTGPHSCFPQEAFSRLPTGMRTGQQHLEGDRAVEAHVPGPVDDAHAAAAHHLQDFITRDPGQFGRGRRRRWAAEGRVGLRRQEKGIQLGVAGAFPLPTPMDLRQQLGAVAAHLFRRPLRVQQFFEQLADARITVHRVPPADDLWNDSGSGTDSAPGRLGLRRCPRH